MRLLKKGFLAIVGSALIASSLYSADEFKALPIFTDDSYCVNMEVSLLGGSVNFDNSAVKDGSVFGIEASLDCPVFTLPGNNLLRQQFSLNRYSKSGIDITTIEVNPYYFIDLSNKLVLGFGPGIGGALVDADGANKTWMFTYQAGAGLKYYMDEFLIGLDVRWQGSVQKDYLGTGNKENIDNTKVIAKVGYRF